MKKLRGLYLFCLMIVLFQSCSTDFEVFAPEEQIFIVYGVLSPDDSLQYIRISLAYQTEGDALVYASETDLSAKGLQVRLKGDNGTNYLAEQVDSVPKSGSGDFYPYHSLYRIRTDGTTGNEALEAGRRYDLEISATGDTVNLSAYTTIPVPAVIQDRTYSGGGTQTCLFRASLNGTVKVAFTPGAHAYGHEMRAYFNYEANGTPGQVVWGPTKLFFDSQGCSDGKVCYQLGEGELINVFKNGMPDPLTTSLTYDNTECDNVPSNLSTALRFEVTSADTFLTNYMIVNDPSNTDVSGTRPEYTNITGTVDAIGIFGSYSTANRYNVLNDCSEYLLGLNNTPNPGPSCQ